MNLRALRSRSSTTNDTEWCLAQLSCRRPSTRVQCLTVKQSLLQVRLLMEEEEQSKEEEEFDVCSLMFDTQFSNSPGASVTIHASSSFVLFLPKALFFQSFWPLLSLPPPPPPPPLPPSSHLSPSSVCFSLSHLCSSGVCLGMTFWRDSYWSGTVH